MRSLPALLRKISALRILVIGDVMLDRYLWGDATRISPEAPVPVVDITRESVTAGGAANVALNLASLGARTTVAGYFGADAAGRSLVATLAEKKIATLSTPGSAQTIVKTRVLVQRQQLCRLDRESPPSAYAVTADAAEKLLRAAIRSHDAVIFSDYAKGILSDELVARITTLEMLVRQMMVVQLRRLAERGHIELTPAYVHNSQGPMPSRSTNRPSLRAIRRT